MKASELRVIANKIIEDHAAKYKIDTALRYELVKDLFLIRANAGKLDCNPTWIRFKYSYVGLSNWIKKHNLNQYQVEYIRRELIDPTSLLIKMLKEDEFQIYISLKDKNTSIVSKIEW